MDWLKDLKNAKRGRIGEYTAQYPKAEFHEGKRPWAVPCDLAFPSATQNEIDENDARTLVDNSCMAVAEGANMPSSLEAIRIFTNSRILYAPSKAANAGGVAVSGLEMTQNSLRLSWTSEETEDKLRGIMRQIHDQCVEYGRVDEQYIDYVTGANVAGFVKVADALISQGVV